MVDLTLVGVSEDRTRLLLVADSGAEFTLVVDPKLRAAVRGEHAGPGQLEIQMDSALRPRDIQARIRAGETPDSVAASAKTTVEKIMPYAAPVLAEREHVAQRAQRSSVRRKTGEGQEGASGPVRSRTLGDAVAGHLGSLDVATSAVTWDAYRREDGRWALTGDFSTSERQGSALFAYDAPGNFVVAENDEARWLLGELAPVPTAERSGSSRRSGKERRLSAVPSDELPLGDDAIEMVSGEDHTATADLGDTPLASADEPAGASAEDEPEARRPARKKARASVPSWDEIMFGGGKQE